MQSSDFVNGILANAMRDDKETEAAMKIIDSKVEESMAHASALRSETVATIAKRLAEAKADDAPVSVIDAYERLLVRASS